MKIVNNVKKTALVTGANSGIGFETAFQLEKAGYDKVILACRTSEKADKARRMLIVRGCKDVFETLVVDVSETFSAIKASDEIISRGHKIDLLILNAGMSSGNTITKNTNGIDMTFASTLVGHHAITMNLLNNGAISPNASIIIAGSESARGDVPGMALPDLDQVAKDNFNGDMYETLKAYAKAEYPSSYHPMKAYALAKLYVAWWATSLSKKVSSDITVNAVSPGSVPATNFLRDMPWAMRNIMIPIMNSIGKYMGMAGSVEDASRRYLEVAQYGTQESGKFFASPPKKLVGKIEEQKTELIQNVFKREEAFRLIADLAGGIKLAKAS